MNEAVNGRQFKAPTFGEFEQLNDQLTRGLAEFLAKYQGRAQGSLSPIEFDALGIMKLVAKYQGMTLQTVGTLVEVGGEKQALQASLDEAKLQLGEASYALAPFAKIAELPDLERDVASSSFPLYMSLRNGNQQQAVIREGRPHVADFRRAHRVHAELIKTGIGT